jgi:putative phosphoribosyl transferase
MVTPPTKVKVKASCPERLVEIPAGQRMVQGSLMVPPERRGMVVFAHGSGSGRSSPRNQFVAQAMRDVGMGTLLIDLLEEDEAQNRANVFDIELLADRLEAATGWLRHDHETQELHLGFFGASTGAGAAVVAASRQPEQISAVVSRGGRPDLAGRSLAKVTAPTLLLVGGRDDDVIQLNREALSVLRCSKEMVIIPGATHLFPEPGALEEVARLAQNWFLRFLTPGSHAHHT